MKKESVKKAIKEIIPYIIILVVVLLIKKFIFTTILVDGPSMQNTLHNKDVMILDKIGIKLKDIKRFDIVVIKTGGTKIIKRVIGLPGEKIEYKENKLYINEKHIEEDYGSDVTYDFDVLEIPENHYFVLGDNRTDSIDSRILGTIEKKILKDTQFLLFILLIVLEVDNIIIGEIDMENEKTLLNNLNKVHTTEMGIDRIRKNLNLDTEDVVKWCINKIKDPNCEVIRKGKNWYVTIDNCIITVNAYSYTIITAHRLKTKQQFAEGI